MVTVEEVTADGIVHILFDIRSDKREQGIRIINIRPHFTAESVKDII